MSAADTTSWNLIARARAGDAGPRDEFARRYQPLVRAYLGDRWRGSPLRAELEDAVQDVFVECFRDGGVLARVEPGRRGGFRAFFYGVIRNVALRCEKRHRDGHREAPPASSFDFEALAGVEPGISRRFDRAWARDVLRAAVAAMNEAAAGDEAAGRRVEILRLRFSEGVPIHEMAKRWGTDGRHLHRDYTKALEEFEAALRRVLSGGDTLTRAELDEQVRELARILQGG